MRTLPKNPEVSPRQIAVMMSGGVDSSLAAALLQQQGHEIIGVTLKLVHQESTHGFGGCCAYSDAVDARRVAQKLGIPHYMLNIAEEFSNLVIEPFKEAYQQGRTPNPCIECNRTIKFNLIREKAYQLGFDAVATGHYARITQENGGCHLRRGIDPAKDQSYFLYTVGRENLPDVVFPVGHLEKTRTRDLAESFALPIAMKPDSQDICFVQGGDYRQSLKREVRGRGRIVDTSGRQLGEHEGIEDFTVGQRKGLRLSGGPWYVIRLEQSTNTVVVGSKEEGLSSRLMVENPVYLEDIAPGQEVQAKIRSRHEPAEATITECSDSGFALEFSEPQWAVTPGQSAVLYDDDLVLGGGLITRGDFPTHA
jgi:tRNA-uridine 2-sulfurtransferase